MSASTFRSTSLGGRLWRTCMAGAASLLFAFLMLPLLGLLTATGWSDLVAGLRHPLALSALKLSLFTTSVTLALVVGLGTPLAWLLARRAGRIPRAVETLLQLPIVIPPAVAGVAMLLAFGRRGLLGRWLYPEGWSLAFTTAAVIMAETFVSAPFFLQAATSAFRRVGEDYITVARSLGASPARVFLRVALPLAAPGLVSGAAMSWARSLGEFGATLMFAGNLTGKTQTLPLAIYTALESDLRVAQSLSLVLVLAAFAFLLLVRGGTARLSRRGERGDEPPERRGDGRDARREGA
ncbi:molybdate ABC transporter permease [Sorangium cellulosum]|uniref:Molybdenum transport system permease n=1 Tax=Sorangium cellulosum TaxID=56 RepID=A0A2L0ESE1_SORCE|nr:ABC transporter permease [Sorangium cellulosum]AUX42209.1 molybdate ABC transporter permease [Sorangium cellulosum]